MKFTYINGSRIPTERAHGLQIVKMCSTLATFKDVEMVLVVPWRFNSIKEDAFSYYDVERNFKLKKLPCLDLVPWDKYLGRSAFWIKEITFLISVSLYLLFKKTDVIYTRDEAVLWLSLAKKNVFFEAHRPLRKFFVKFLKKSRGVITISNGLKDFFVLRGIAENKILVARSAVDLQVFNIEISKEAAREKLNLPQDKKIILYTGSLLRYTWKGVDVLLKAAQQIQQEGREDILFLLVGGSEQEVEEIKAAYPSENLLLRSHRPHREIPYYLKAADVLVLSNRRIDPLLRKYTSPLKLFEYMASKRPIVASDLPSLGEVLNRNNSFLVASNDPTALAEGIKSVLLNPGLAAKIAGQAFRDVQGHTWHKRAERILNLVRTKTKR